MSKTSPSQQHQMETSFFRLMSGNLVSLFFSWIGLNTFLMLKTIPPIYIWTILALVLFLIALLVAQKMKRAYQYHLLVLSLASVNSFLLFDGSIRLLLGSESRFLSWDSFIVLLLGSLVTLLGFWGQVQVSRAKLRASVNLNVQSQRLDLKKGFWNLDAPLRLESPDVEKRNSKIWKRVSILSPLVTALGFVFARSTTGNIQTILFAVCLYILGCAFVWSYAKHLSIVLQLKEWEVTNKIIIKI